MLFIWIILCSKWKRATLPGGPFRIPKILLPVSIYSRDPRAATALPRPQCVGTLVPSSLYQNDVNSNTWTELNRTELAVSTFDSR